MISFALWIRDLRRSESQFGGLEGRFDLRLRFADASTDYQPGLVRSTGSMAAPAADIELPLVMDRSQATGLADELAGQMALQRERARFAMAADGVAIEAGDVVVIADRQWRIVDVSDGKVIRFEAVRAGAPSSRRLTPALPATPPGAVIAPEPDVVIVGAPALPGEEDDLRPLGFAFADPWAGAVVFKGGADADQQVVRGSVERPCAVGRLVSALFPHVSGRWQETSVWVAVVGSAPASASKSAVLNGANRALVETGAGWEMIQFLEAELVDVDTYKLTGLLRGQQGTENAMGAGADIGVRIVFLTGAEQRLAVADWERGLEMDWSAGGWSGRLFSCSRCSATVVARAPADCLRRRGDPAELGPPRAEGWRPLGGWRTGCGGRRRLSDPCVGWRIGARVGYSGHRRIVRRC